MILEQRARGSRSCGSFGVGTAVQGIVVGLGVAETAAFAALVGDEGGGAFAGGEAAAGRGAFGVRGAGASYKLGALGSGIDGDWGDIKLERK